MTTIRYRDVDLPPGLCIADGNGVRPWDENSAKELALDAMILSQGAARGQQMLDALPAQQAEHTPAASSH
jgi:hypothetical protein